MAKDKKDLEEINQESKPSVPNDRNTRWQAFLEKAKVQNPVKFALKEAKGEFTKIPDSFK